MATANESVIVSGGACSCCSSPTVHVHHRDYPEAVAEGFTAEMAAGHLANQLARSLDHTPDLERRGAIEQALAEVRHFLTRHDPAPRAAGGGEVEGDVRPLGSARTGARTTALVKTENREVIRLVIPRGKEIPTHKTRGQVTVHCLEGRVNFTTDGITHELRAGHMLYLQGEQPHSVLGIDGCDREMMLIAMFLAFDSLTGFLDAGSRGNPPPAPALRQGQE